MHDSFASGILKLRCLCFEELADVRAKLNPAEWRLSTVFDIYLICSLLAARWTVLFALAGFYPANCPCMLALSSHETAQTLPLTCAIEDSQQFLYNATATLSGSVLGSSELGAPIWQPFSASELYRALWLAYTEHAAGKLHAFDEPICMSLCSWFVPMPGQRRLWPFVTYTFRYLFALNAPLRFLTRVVRGGLMQTGFNWSDVRALILETTATSFGIALLMLYPGYQDISLWQELLVDLPLWIDAFVSLIWRFGSLLLLHPYIVGKTPQSAFGSLRILLLMAACTVISEFWRLLYGQSELVRDLASA